MTYRERLTPWILVRFLPGMQRVIVSRFHKRVDAEGHLQFLQQQGGEFVIMFDLPAPNSAISSAANFVQEQSARAVLPQSPDSASN